MTVTDIAGTLMSATVITRERDMRVFVTGASGWIGSAVVDELIADGHEVVGLARSDASAARLEARGALARRGDLDDHHGLRTGALEADAVVHLANKHDFGNLAATNATERAATATLGAALEGTGKPFLLASGLAEVAPGRLATEHDPSTFHGPDSARGGSENLLLEHVARGVHAVAVRFSPTTHGVGDRGFVDVLASVARAKGVSGHPGDGSNRWAAVHVRDAARVVALGLTKAPAGSRLHAVAEEGITTREIAEALGAALDLPVASVAPRDVAGHFGWIGGFFALDMAASSALTRESLGWEPTGPTLLADIAAGAYTR